MSESENSRRFNLRRPSDPLGTSWGNPYRHINRLLALRIGLLIEAARLGKGARVLDYGCGVCRYRPLLPADCQYLPADISGNPAAEITIAADGRLDVADASCDLVLSIQTLEHVADPKLYLQEAMRVLRPGGYLLLSTHGTMALHRDPVDYWRWTSDGLRHVLTTAGFDCREFHGLMGLAATGVQLFQDATARSLPKSLRVLYVGLLQSIAAFLDRHTSRKSCSLNALVYASLCRKSADTRSSP